jgi:putative hydrolase of the HAD superfamily
MKKIIPSPKGILFDMDGVLLLSTQRSDQSWQQVSQQFAPRLHIPPLRLEEALTESRYRYRKEIEQDTQKQRRDRLQPFETRCEATERGLERVGKGDAMLAAEMVRAYEAVSDQHRQLAPLAGETLQKLRDHALPLALVSNGNATYQRRKINTYHLASFFDAIFIEEEFGVAKPDEQIFLAALNALHIPAQEAWMVGDDLARDIAASQRLGLFAIWCDPARHGLLESIALHPDYCIHDLSELLDLLKDTRVLY